MYFPYLLFVSINFQKCVHLLSAPVFILLAGATPVLQAEVSQDEAAPSVDRVGFPTDYEKKFTVLRAKTDAKDATQVTIYGNAQTASITELAALPYPNGAVIVMETASLKKGADGEALVDAEGKYLRDLVLGLHVMRREAGFGAAYGSNRSGEWEYAEYRADGTYITPPPKTAACSACHVKAGPERDFVFKARFSDTAK